MSQMHIYFASRQTKERTLSLINAHESLLVRSK